MNILYVVDLFPKLSETFILNEVVELTNRGHSVQILALRNPQEKLTNEDVLKNNLLNKTSYLELPNSLKLKLTYAFSKVFYNNILNSIRNNKGKTTYKDLIKLSYFSTRYSNVDIVHAHFAAQAAITGMQIAKIINKPFTFTAHAYEIFKEKNYSRNRLIMLVENASKVITPSKFNKDYIVRETNCSEDKIEIVRATICPEKFKIKEPITSEEDKIKIIAIGRLVEKKGFEYLIKAMKLIVQRNPNAFLNIIGEGELENDLRKQSYNLGLAKSVNFLGALSNEKCIDELSSSDIAVLPCVKARDGDLDVCPLTLQEAMAMEIPVISTTVGSVPELIEDGIEGILVPERDENALADAIIKLIDNPTLRRKLGQNGRMKIIKEFNIKTQVNRLVEIWQTIIDNNDEDKCKDKIIEKFDPYEYWSSRSKKFGKAAVGNLSKPIEECEKGSEAGKKKLLPLFASFLEGNESRLLDFGCGYGRFTRNLSEFVTDEAWGVDATSELIEIAEQEKTNQKTFFTVSRGNIPFSDNYFDIVWVSYVLEHLIGDEKEKIAKELLRVLKPNGLLFIVVNTVIGHQVKQCDIRTFNWYEKVFTPIEFEVKTEKELKTINKDNIEELEKEYEDIGQNLVLILIGKKPKTNK